jgi:hypothetical protein
LRIAPHAPNRQERHYRGLRARARANFGKLLRRVKDERRSLVIEKQRMPKAVLLSTPGIVTATNLSEASSTEERSRLAVWKQDF